MVGGEDGSASFPGWTPQPQRIPRAIQGQGEAHLLHLDGRVGRQNLRPLCIWAGWRELLPENLRG